MTEARDPLTLDSVLARFTASEKLLNEAGVRLAALADAHVSAEASASALSDASEAVREAATRLKVMTEVVQAAQDLVAESLGVAADFLRQSDLTGLVKATKALGDRVRSLEKTQAAMTDRLLQQGDDTQALVANLVSELGRSAALERERDDYKRQVDQLVSQLPERVLRKIKR